MRQSSRRREPTELGGLAFENHLCDGLLGGVRERERSILHAESGGKLCCLSMKRNRRAPARQACDFAIAPAHAVALHAFGLRIAIADPARRKNALYKAIAKAFDRLPDARDLRDIDACAH